MDDGVSRHSGGAEISSFVKLAFLLPFFPFFLFPVRVLLGKLFTVYVPSLHVLHFFFFSTVVSGKTLNSSTRRFHRSRACRFCREAQISNMLLMVKFYEKKRRA